jgi:hypothetical protein
MKIPAIKKLVESYSEEELLKAENDIMEGLSISIDVEGEDEGEQLTHVIAAAFILKEMEGKKIDFKEALREYTKKVRESIN